MQLIVLGMHRSGTSVLARLLNMMGAYFGPEGVSTGANKENPKGFWERRDVRELSDFVLHSVDCDWNKVAAFDPKKIPDTIFCKFGDRAANIVLELDAHRPWLLKEPRLCLLLENWKEFLEVPVCIHIYRNPVEVAQSLNIRNGIPVHTGIALWEKYNQSALEASSGLPRFVVSHNRLMQSPEMEVKFIYEQLLSFSVRGLHLPTNKEVTSFVRNELYRNRANDIDLGQYLNSAQLIMFEEFSSGGILEERDHYALSESCLPMLSEYEVSEESKKAAEEAQQAASQREADLEKKLAEQEQSLSQQAKAAEEAQRAAREREVGLEKKLAEQEQSLSQQAKAAEEAQQAARQRETELENRLESRDQKIANIENELLLQSQAKNDAIKLGEKRLQDVNQLTRWMHIIEFHLGSPRWRTGRSALGVMAKAVGKRNADIKNDQLFSVLKKFKIWKGASEQSEVSASGKEHDRHQELIKNSGLFDESWYLDRNPDVKESGTNPLEHFIKFGWKEKRNPGPEFDTKWYLHSNSDVAKAGINPLEHFILFGQDERRSPKPIDTLKNLPWEANPNAQKARTPDAAKIRSHIVRHQASVAVVIPVYNAFSDVQKCLQSVVQNTPRNTKIIVINDASTDHRVDKMLDSFTSSGNLSVYRNETNLGFTGTVNRGFDLAGNSDVVLLNSDTVVAHGWISRLQLAAYSDERVGTATPFSNNAGAFSAPIMGKANELPQCGFADFARAIAQASLRLYPKTPTGNGFCMYIRRDCLMETGPFDVDAFPRGYGEENDFCMRAAEKNWSHVIDDATYIYHARSASFGEEKKVELLQAGRAVIDKRHPEYTSKVRAFVKSDDVMLARAQVQDVATAVTRLGSKIRPRVLYVLPTLSPQGGTPQTNQDLMQAIGDRVETFLLRSNAVSVELFSFRNGNYELVESASLAAPIKAFPHRSDEYDAIVSEWLVRYAIEITHIRHIAFHGLGLIDVSKALGIPVVFSFHDFYTVCPTVKLLDETQTFCGGVCTKTPGDCQHDLWKDPKFPVLKNAAVEDWRDIMGTALAKCDAFVTTADSSRSLLIKNFALLKKLPIHVIPHGRDFTAFSDSASREMIANETIRILAPGSIGYAKGAGVLRELSAQANSANIEIHVLGRIAQVGPLPGVIEHGAYHREEFVTKVNSIQPHLGAVLSIWAETYSHTLTELWAAGLPVIGFDLGAVAERIRASQAGWVISEKTAESILGLVKNLRANPEEYKQKLNKVRSWQTHIGGVRTSAWMSDRYHELYESIAPSSFKRTRSNKESAAVEGVQDSV